MSMLKGGKLVVHCPREEDRTKQKTGMEHDINKIIARFKRTGELPLREDVQGIFADVSEIGSYQDCVQRIMDANELFMKYPSEVRRKFDNDVAKFSDFIIMIADEKNTKEIELAKQLGILEVKAAEPPIEPAKPAEPAK